MKKDAFPKDIEVVCHSGYKANERPLFFVMDYQKREVKDVLDRWYGEDHDYFKVLADDGKVYLLRWHRALDRWSVEKTMAGTGRHMALWGPGVME